MNDAKIFEEEELAGIESDNPDGITAQRIIDYFERKGVNIAEATFRKYVQLGLLPRSRRIGRKGRHKGSQGIYPSNIIRRINEIKWMMHKGMTIEQMQEEYLMLGGDIDELEDVINRIIKRIFETGRRNNEENQARKNDIEEIQNQANKLLQNIKRLSTRMAARVRVAQTAI